jgi:hypothetical protein
MPRPANTNEHDEFSLALIAPWSRRILVSRSGDRYRFPSLLVPSGRRLAYSLTEAVESKYGLATIQLALLPRGSSPGFAVHEVLSTSGQDSDLVEINLEEMDSDELSDDERDLIRKIIEGQETSQGRFARLGWVNELLARIEPFLVERDHKTTGLVRHFNAGIDFSLLWIHIDSGPNLWFKAVGEPNTREFALTVELAKMFPTCLPRIVCAMPDWNAWVAEDLEGSSMSAAGDELAAARTLRVLAGMQIDAITHVSRLRQLGAVEWPLSRLLSLQDGFFAEMASIMAAQTSTRSQPLTMSDLGSLQSVLRNALMELMAIGIPDSLVHGDIGHGNIKLTKDGPVFLDWAETYIGHPFLTAEHLLVDLERSNPNLNSEQRNKLRDVYLAEWIVFASEVNLATAARLMPGVAAFAYAVMIWHMSRTYPDPTQTWSLLRSLMRRIRQELDCAMEVRS